MFGGQAIELPQSCTPQSREIGAAALIFGFVINALLEEAMEAINAAKLRRIKSLTKSYGAFRNFKDFFSADTVFNLDNGGRTGANRQTDCIVVEHRADASETAATNAIYVFGVGQSGNSRAMAFTPLMAMVNSTSANANARRNRNIDVHVAFALSAIVSACENGTTTCGRTQSVVLGTPEFNFGDLTPGTPYLCEAGDGRQTGCEKLGPATAFMPMAPADTPNTIAAAVSVTSVTLEDAQAEQEMWERHRGALLELLQGFAGKLTEDE